MMSSELERERDGSVVKTLLFDNYPKKKNISCLKSHKMWYNNTVFLQQFVSLSLLLSSQEEVILAWKWFLEVEINSL